MVAQSVAFAYAPASGTRVESDPLNLGAEGTPGRSAEAAAALEQAVLGLPEGIVLRFGYFYGPGTWYDTAVADAIDSYRGRGAGNDAGAHQGKAGHLQYRGGWPRGVE